MFGRQEAGRDFHPDSSGSNPRGAERTPLLDFNGPGVTTSEITRWKAAGNSVDEKQDNNPLSLIRPASLVSMQSYSDINYLPDHSKPNRSKDKSNRSDMDRYIQTNKAFYEFATAVVVSLNEADPEKRRGSIRKKLDQSFSDQRTIYPFSYNIRKNSPAEDPAVWLAYSVISILDNPSEGITSVGRVRALELLQLFSAKELAKVFRRERGSGYYGKEYDKMHIERLPYTFCTEEERLKEDHKDIWGKNQRIQQILVKDANGKIDWRVTSYALIERAPEEAIQVALLLLHSDDVDTTEGALGFLSSVPQLESEVRSRMFGEKATFLIEHKLDAGIDGVVVEGLVTSEVAGSDLVEQVTEKSKEELMQMLGESAARTVRLEALLVATNSRAEEFDRQTVQLKAENRRLQEESNRTRTAYVQLEASRATNMVDQLDPKGYYRSLGLEGPQEFNGLNEEQIQKMLTAHYKGYSLVCHPDKPTGSTKKMQLLIEAYEFMQDRNKRSSYG